MIGLLALVFQFTLANIGFRDFGFGEPCEVVRSRVLEDDEFRILDNSECASPEPSDPTGEGYLGFKAYRMEASDMFIYYFTFTDAGLTSYMVGTVMGMDVLDMLAEQTYAPFDTCFQIVDSGFVADRCITAVGPLLVEWTASEAHSSLRYQVLETTGDEIKSPVTQEPPALATEGFVLLSCDFRWEDGVLWVLGEVRNVSSAPAGVQLQAIARDRSGRLVDVATFWPASTTNVQVGATYGFRYPVTREQSAVQVDFQIVDSTEW